MKVIVCLDKEKGMMFRNRRQSRDRAVVEDIMKMCKKGMVFMNDYSQPLFEKYPQKISVTEDFLEKAGKGALCFVENLSLKPWEERIDQMIIYWWNRSYPEDKRFDVNLENWNLIYQEEFQGYSHETITKEIYER